MKKIIIILLVLAFICSISFNPVKGNENGIFLKVANEYIKTHENFMRKLMGVTPVSPMVYNDKNGYGKTIVFGLSKNNEVTGRLVINYDVNNPIVLEYAQVAPPHLLDVKKIVQSKISLTADAVLGTPEFIYIFPLLYFVKFDIIKNGVKIDGLYFYWNEKKLVKEEDIPDFPAENPSSSNFQENPITQSNTYNYINDVPDYNTGDNPGLCNCCGPVAEANILGYWHKHGYPNLQLTSDEMYGIGLTTCLFSDMGTYGTTPAMFTGGIVYHANNSHGAYPNCNYHFTADSGFIYSVQNAYQYLCNEVKNSRPVGILLNWNVINWHWIVGIGYNTTTNEACVRDSWGNGDVWLNWYSPYLDGGSIGFQYLSYVYPAY